MAGLIDVGTAYKDRAMSGFIRNAADEQRIDQTNKDLKSAKEQSNVQNVTAGIGAVLSLIALL